MTSKKRNILVGLLLVVSISLSFYFGFKYGVKYAWGLYTPTLGMESYGQALTMEIALEHIDKSNIKEAHENLCMYLNGNIITLDELVKHKDKNSDMFTRMLKRISDHRQSYPDKYLIQNIKDPDEKEIYAVINNILEKYKK